jgi:hypothetical protein
MSDDEDTDFLDGQAEVSSDEGDSSSDDSEEEGEEEEREGRKQMCLFLINTHQLFHLLIS